MTRSRSHVPAANTGRARAIECSVVNESGEMAVANASSTAHSKEIEPDSSGFLGFVILLSVITLANATMYFIREYSRFLAQRVLASTFDGTLPRGILTGRERIEFGYGGITGIRVDFPVQRMEVILGSTGHETAGGYTEY